MIMAKNKESNVTSEPSYSTSALPSEPSLPSTSLPEESISKEELSAIFNSTFDLTNITI